MSVGTSCSAASARPTEGGSVDLGAGQRQVVEIDHAVTLRGSGSPHPTRQIVPRDDSGADTPGGSPGWAARRSYPERVVRSPLALAALATVAVPGLDAFDVRRPARPGTDYDTAVVIDSTRQRWVVRAPQHPAAGAALEAEVVLLSLLALSLIHI